MYIKFDRSMFKYNNHIDCTYGNGNRHVVINGDNTVRVILEFDNDSSLDNFLEELCDNVIVSLIGDKKYYDINESKYCNNIVYSDIRVKKEF